MPLVAGSITEVLDDRFLVESEVKSDSRGHDLQMFYVSKDGG